MDTIKELPIGAEFILLGVRCVVARYADESESAHGDHFGLVYWYADDHGILRTDEIAPRDFEALRIHLGFEKRPILRQVKQVKLMTTGQGSSELGIDWMFNVSGAIDIPDLREGDRLLVTVQRDRWVNFV